VLVVHQNWFRGLVNELHVVVIVSQVPEFVYKQLRKTVMYSSTAHVEQLLSSIKEVNSDKTQLY